MADGSSVPVPDAVAQYWQSRQDLIYYQVVRQLAAGLASDAEAILDVGSNGCPYLEWFKDAPHRTSNDLRHPYRAEGIQSIKGNFLTWKPDRQYDLVLCLQVLEHVPNAAEFAQKLLACGRIVIASVPYRWPEGGTKYHVHDPVDEAKMRTWFGRPPNYSYICAEVTSTRRRMICVYDSIPRSWHSLSQRRRIIEGTLPLSAGGGKRSQEGSKRWTVFSSIRRKLALAYRALRSS